MIKSLIMICIAAILVAINVALLSHASEDNPMIYLIIFFVFLLASTFFIYGINLFVIGLRKK
jgi:hypothetical protein